MAVYKSPYADLQVLVRSESVQYHPATGVEIGRVKPLTVNFGSHSGEFTSTSPLTGELEQHAIIHGHYFDSESAAEERGWDKDEHDSVVYTLDRLAREQPYLLAKVDLSRPASGPPWPTYDETPEKEIFGFAATLGLVRETILYEQENKNRTKLLDQLQKFLLDNMDAQVEDALEEQGVTVGHDLSVGKPGLITLG